VQPLVGWVTEHAPAKINLHLAVTGRRPDGYHLLDSLAVFAGAHDTLHAAHAEDALTLEIRGPFAAALPVTPDNLVLRAARALAELAGRPDAAKLVLEKNLPVASGIGGGSADAAATLRALARLWRLTLKPRDLHELALELGADVPVCLDRVPRRMGGIGDVLTSAPALPPYGIALVNPGVGVSTASVFRARVGLFSADAELPAGWVDAAAMGRRLSVLANDLEHAAVSICPEIGLVLETLRAAPGCLLARMSGSGATCFALFETPERAREAAWRCDWPRWWRWGGAPWSNADDGAGGLRAMAGPLMEPGGWGVAKW
jgi:4-diphosphocytidyl-2-C-methyl-D-erythritol kinase